jgi:PIN domain nuclease of toxin-antitoxin system
VKLLLDTHCLLWLLTDSDRLGTGARRAIAQAESVCFSDASLWELGLKWRKGKIGLQPRQIAEQALRNGLRPMAIDREALLVSSELKHVHGVPFDRLLFAQARVAGMKLLSIDRTVAELAATLRVDEEVSQVKALKTRATRRKLT